MDNLKKELQYRIYVSFDTSKELQDEEIREVIEEWIAKYAKRQPISLKERQLLSKELFDSFRKLDVLQQLLDDKTVTEIMINGQNHIFFEKNGAIHQWDRTFSSKEKLEDVIQQIVGKNNRVVNEASPIVDTRLEDGSRVNVVLSPISIDGPALTIRKFPEDPITMEKLLYFGSLSEEIVAFLQKLVIAKYNIFISGGTGSGKTTFLNALSNFIPEDERIITIEDSAELQIKSVKNLVRLETRNANQQDVIPITIRDLIRSSLRMRPDRIIVGECRGGEAADMLVAFNSGHSGSISTGHANSCKDMLSRLETMVLMGMEIPISAIRSQIASGVEILIHLGRLRDKSRKLLMIAEVLGMENGEVVIQPLFRFEETGMESGKIAGRWIVEHELVHQEKLKAAGFTEL